MTLASVVAAFASAPVNNPNRPTGITLRLTFDETIAHRESCPFDDTCFDAVKRANFGTAAERAKPNPSAILAAKRQVFHYALWAHARPGGWTGIGETPGNDVMLTVGLPLPKPGQPIGARVAAAVQQATDLVAHSEPVGG